MISIAPIRIFEHKSGDIPGYFETSDALDLIRINF